MAPSLAHARSGRPPAAPKVLGPRCSLGPRLSRVAAPFKSPPNIPNKNMERVMGFEPTTSSLARTRSTTELHPRAHVQTQHHRRQGSSRPPRNVMDERGVEPLPLSGQDPKSCASASSATRPKRAKWAAKESAPLLVCASRRSATRASQGGRCSLSARSSMNLGRRSLRFLWYDSRTKWAAKESNLQPWD